MQEVYIVTCGGHQGEVDLKKTDGTFFFTIKEAERSCFLKNKKLNTPSFRVETIHVKIPEERYKVSFTDNEIKEIIKRWWSNPSYITYAEHNDIPKKYDEKIAKWTGFVVDIEAVGPIPGDFSMIEIGAVVLTRDLKKTFYTTIAPINRFYMKSTCDSIGINFNHIKENFKITPLEAMSAFKNWIDKMTKTGTRPMFFSDNNGFDFMFTHWYFMHFLKENPFGFTSRNIADIFRGMNKNMTANFKHLRDTKHTHNPLDDAMGNAEALIKFIDRYGLEGINIE